jgi:hypothetical protein
VDEERPRAPLAEEGGDEGLVGEDRELDTVAFRAKSILAGFT